MDFVVVIYCRRRRKKEEEEEERRRRSLFFFSRLGSVVEIPNKRRVNIRLVIVLKKFLLDFPFVFVSYLLPFPSLSSFVEARIGLL